MGNSNYENHTTQSANPFARFAHRTRVKFSIALVDKWAPFGGAVVDFGAGTGLFINSLHSRRGDLHLYGVEPYMTARTGGLRFLADFASISDEGQDIVTAFEVYEHLYAHEVNKFLSESFRVLHDSGKLILSVPIMLGPVVILKEINRMLFVRKFDYSLKEILSAAIGRNVSRASNIKISHKGFDFRNLEPVLAPRFLIREMIYSPFPKLPWWANSQVFFVCSKTSL